LNLSRLSNIFEERFHSPCRLFRAPGRVNLIGEHTDYNAGLVLPVAIELSVVTAAAPRGDNKIRAISLQLPEELEFDLAETSPSARGQWTDYVQGVAHTLTQAGYPIRGANLLIDSNLPVGGGLSSSAALEVSAANALLALSSVEAPAEEVAFLCQKAESDFAGMRCGIMDQFTSSLARAGHAMLLDCALLEIEFVPLPADVRLVVANTMIKHKLQDSDYNQRRAECEQAARLLGAASLRAASDLSSLPAHLLPRARHVISENARVAAAAAALRRADPAEFGRLMAESHASLRDDYQVSCPELDTMVAIASAQPGVWGARMTGGGFGGCTVNLVAADAVDSVCRALAHGYREATGINPVIHVCQPAGGASELPAPSSRTSPEPALRQSEC